MDKELIKKVIRSNEKSLKKFAKAIRQKPPKFKGKSKFTPIDKRIKQEIKTTKKFNNKRPQINIMKTKGVFFR